MSEQSEIPVSPAEPKMTRRQFFRHGGKVALLTGAALASHELNKRLGVYQKICASAEDLLTNQIIIPEMMTREPSFQAWKKEYEDNWRNYEGPLKIHVSKDSELGPTHWSDEDYQNITDSFTTAERTVKEVFGEEVAWEKDKVVVVVSDFMNFYSGDSKSKMGLAGYLNGESYDRAHPQLREALSKVRLLIVPQKLLADTRSIPYYFNGVVSHELTHAYYGGSNFLPKIWKEGISEMVRLLNIKDQLTEERFKKSYLDEAKKDEVNLNNTEQMGRESLSGTKINNPVRAEALYQVAGYLFYDWRQQHPSFFKDLRQKENQFYETENRIPTKEEWLTFAGDEFKTWVESQPLLNIRD